MPHQQVEASSPDSSPVFSEHCRQAFQDLRLALTKLLASIPVDPGQPQQMARRFGLNKNLTWKISRVVRSTDVALGLRHLPGRAGLEILLAALAKAGAEPSRLVAVRSAQRAFEQMTSLHAGDRAQLELLAASLSPHALDREHMEQSRRLAYIGNSSTWGVQARVRLGASIVAPSRTHPDLLDSVEIAGLIGFKRLRPDVQWLLFRRQILRDDGTTYDKVDIEPLDPEAATQSGAPLVRAFCTSPLPELNELETNGETHYELQGGPVGNTAAFDCVLGAIIHRIRGTAHTPSDRFLEQFCNLSTPVEQVQFDLLVHESLSWAQKPEVRLYSRMDGGNMDESSRRTRDRLPLAETIHELGRGLAATASPLVPETTEMLAYAFERAGRDPDEFRVFRFTMAYPPIPTAVLFSSALPVPPA